MSGPSSAADSDGIHFIRDSDLSTGAIATIGALGSLSKASEASSSNVTDLGAGWYGYRRETDNFSNLIIKTADNKDEVAFCGAFFGCEKFEKNGALIKCLSSTKPPLTLNTGMIKNAESTYINLNQLASTMKVEVCTQKDGKNVGGLRVSRTDAGVMGTDCNLSGYRFPKSCGAIYVSAKTVECYRFGSLIGSLPSKFSEEQVAQIATERFGQSRVQFSKLIKGNPTCDNLNDHVRVESFETLWAASWPNNPSSFAASTSSSGRR